MADTPITLADQIASRDIERRRIGFASMRAKLASAAIVLEAAAKLANEAEVTHVYQLNQQGAGKDTTAVQAQSYCQSEAIFAATEEVMKTLELVQILSTKLSGTKNVPPLDRFSKAIENGGPTPRT